jgi:preprotein translocase subunit SecA
MFRTISRRNLLKQSNPNACYAERLENDDQAGAKLWAWFLWHFRHRWYFGSRHLARIVGPVETQGKGLAQLGNRALREEVDKVRAQLRQQGFRPDLIARCFALIRETASRTVGMKHFPVQLIGGLALLRGHVTEMATGEGKTLTATLPAGTAALAGLPCHVITVNDYLVERDAELMRPVYEALGLSVGYVLQGMDPAKRAQAYRCDITYCSNKELVFDYLKDKIVLRSVSSPAQLQLERLYKASPRADKLLHRGLYYAIVDEADSVMVDEARTPLIISGQKSTRFEDQRYHEALELAKCLEEKRDFTLEPGGGRATLTNGGKDYLESLAESREQFWKIRPNREELACIALQAMHHYFRDVQYLVDPENKVQIIDEFTGRVMPDRSWEGGLHQMIEAKEGVEISGYQDTVARITYQRFFRRYLHLCGMTGTVAEVSKEMWMVYRLKTVRIPTNRPCIRKELRTEVFSTADRKWSAIVDHVASLHREQGRPILIGTRSVEASEHLGSLFTTASLPHTILNARQDKEEAEIVRLAGQPKQITIATNMAGRGTDIHLGRGIAEIGGLHVILTERHEARRVDRQLFGRCARQGDPGTCIALTSLEDELVKIFREKMPAGLAKLFPQGEVMPRRMRLLVVWLSQVSAEFRNAAIRRDTLQMDRKLDQMLSFTGRVE